MWPYWFLFLIPAFYSISKFRLVDWTASSPPLQWRLMGILIFLMVGFRFEVGGDWFTYLEQLEELNIPFDNIVEIGRGEFSYKLLNWLAIQIGIGIYLPNLVSSCLFTLGLMSFCQNSPRPWLALLLAVPYLIIVVAMGYTRQGASIGLMMFGLVALKNNNHLKFLFWATLAALFHKSSVILVPLALFTGSRRPIINSFAIIVTGILLFVLILQEHVDFLIYGYLEQNYQSSGAAIRIAMNAIPACIFLIYKKRFKLNSNELNFWSWMSYGALAFILLLIISPSSTAVDRVALYWIPIQIYVGSRLPDALGSKTASRKFWVVTIIAYCAIVQMVWLVFGDTSYAWIPYKFFLWEWIWT